MDRRSLRRARLEVRFGVSKYADGKVLDMRGPLCCQLKELDIVPLHPIDQDCRGGLKRRRKKEGELKNSKWKWSARSFARNLPAVSRGKPGHVLRSGYELFCPATLLLSL